MAVVDRHNALGLMFGGVAMAHAGFAFAPRVARAAPAVGEFVSAEMKEVAERRSRRGGPVARTVTRSREVLVETRAPGVWLAVVTAPREQYDVTCPSAMLRHAELSRAALVGFL